MLSCDNEDNFNIETANQVHQPKKGINWATLQPENGVWLRFTPKENKYSKL